MMVAQAQTYRNMQEMYPKNYVPPVTNEEIERTLMRPYDLGTRDAEAQRPFCPEECYADIQRKADYTLGFLEVQPHNEVALAFWAYLTDDQDDGPEMPWERGVAP